MSSDRVKNIKEKLLVETQMSLIKVWTDTGDTGRGKPAALIAKIIHTNPPNMTIKYLSKTDEEYKGCTIWRYEDETYEIDDESVTEWLETDEELEIGYKVLPHDTEAFVYYESDGDYAPSEEEGSDDGDDESVEDEDYEDDFGDDYEDEEDCAWD